MHSLPFASVSTAHDSGAYHEPCVSRSKTDHVRSAVSPDLDCQLRTVLKAVLNRPVEMPGVVNPFLSIFTF